jgi:putative lipoprotein (rSAM/lipoprotein system)
MKKSVIKFYDKALVALLSFLGVFGSCDKDTAGEEPRVEYGMPYATYEIKGVVTDKKTDKPIPNIRIVKPVYEEFGDTLYTDANGKYVFNFSDFPENEKTFKLKAEDIDGFQNGGLFISEEIDVVITKADKVESGQGWYSGKFVKTKDIELNRYEGPIPMYGVMPSTFKPSIPEQ